MLKELLIIIAMASAYPVGLFLAYLTKDELVSGRKWFKAIVILSLIICSALLIFYRDYPVILALFYIAAVSFISLMKSYDKKFVKV